MSEPGAPPTAGAPPPPGGGAAAGNPWEQRDRLGFGAAFVDNVKLFVTAPAEAYRRTLPSGDYVSPLLFALGVGWLGVVFQQLWSAIMGASFLSMIPREVSDQIGWTMAFSGAGLVASLIAAPVFIAIGLFIWSALLHLCLIVVGGLGESRAGFEGTFRVVSYAAVAQLGHLVPLAGGLVTLVWSIILGVVGFTEIHRTTQGKAVAAMLLPLALCCACLLALVFGGLAFFASQQ